MNKRIIYLLFLFWFLFPAYSYATLYRGAEITYTYIGDSISPQKYSIIINTCTQSSSTSDRPYIFLDFGDGVSDTIPRIQIIPDSSGFDSQQNIYYVEHNYPGPGVYVINFIDANRIQGIINIPGSVNQPICIGSQITINPFTAPNNSVQFSDYACPAFGCVNQPFCYAIPAFDPDGDSLSFELLPCQGDECDPLGGYQFPGLFGGDFTLDSLTGEICWDAPVIAGDYNILYRIREWRTLNGNTVIEVGNTMRDMQIHVLSGCSIGIEEKENDLPVTIYPNPTTDKLNLFSGSGSSFYFEIYNSIGEIIYTGKFHQTTTIDAFGWSDGIYYIRYSDGENSGYKKLVKE